MPSSGSNPVCPNSEVIMISTVESARGAFFKTWGDFIEEDQALKYIKRQSEHKAKRRIEEWKAKIKLFPMKTVNAVTTAK